MVDIFLRRMLAEQIPRHNWLRYINASVVGSLTNYAVQTAPRVKHIFICFYGWAWKLRKGFTFCVSQSPYKCVSVALPGQPRRHGWIHISMCLVCCWIWHHSCTQHTSLIMSMFQWMLQELDAGMPVAWTNDLWPCHRLSGLTSNERVYCRRSLLEILCSANVGASLKGHPGSILRYFIYTINIVWWAWAKILHSALLYT